MLQAFIIGLRILSEKEETIIIIYYVKSVLLLGYKRYLD